MPKQAWICKKCLTPYEDEGTASECEERHIAAKDIEIVGVSYDCNEAYPKEICLKMPHAFLKGTKMQVFYVKKKKQ